MTDTLRVLRRIADTPIGELAALFSDDDFAAEFNDALEAESGAALGGSAPSPSPDAVEVERLRALLNTPEIEDFDKAVPLEAAHQVERWGVAHDDGKEPEAWFWLIGYLAGKALSAMKAGDTDKAKHHTISTAAALRNWHAHIRQGWTLMRPGVAEPAGASSPGPSADPTESR